MVWAIVGIIAAIFAGVAVVSLFRRRRGKSRRTLSAKPHSAAAVSISPSVRTSYSSFGQVPLISEVEADYTSLQNLLLAQKYQEADCETYQVVLKVAQRERQGWLRHSDIDDFPTADLQTIDRLWVTYSNGRFGFSVQKQIYQGLGGTRGYNEGIWQAWGDRVGWRVAGNWLSYSQLTFDINAPQGHLPAAGGVWVGGVPRVVGWGHGRYLISRQDL